MLSTLLKFKLILVSGFAPSHSGPLQVPLAGLNSAPDPLCLPWLHLTLTLGATRWSQPVAALSLRFNWLSKIGTDQLPSPRDVWTRITYQPLQPTASTASLHWYVSPRRPLESVVAIVHHELRFRGKVLFATSLFCVEVLLFALPVGSNSHFRSMPGPGVPLPSSSSSSLHRYIPALVLQILKRLICCHSPPFCHKYDFILTTFVHIFWIHDYYLLVLNLKISDW